MLTIIVNVLAHSLTVIFLLEKVRFATCDIFARSDAQSAPLERDSHKVKHTASIGLNTKPFFGYLLFLLCQFKVIIL